MKEETIDNKIPVIDMRDKNALLQASELPQGDFPTDEKSQRERAKKRLEEETAKQGIVEFTDEEIKQMPKKIQRLLILDGKRCRLRTRDSGNGTQTYEIRYRRSGYSITACGKTIALAKTNFIKKAKTAQTKGKETETTIPDTFTSFTIYYFEKFRKPKVSAQTYYNDENRLNKHLFPFFKEKKIKKITPSDCQTIYDNLRGQGKNKTADEIYSLMSVIFKGAIAHDIIQKNPLDVVVKLTHQKVHGSALTREEEKAFLTAIKGSTLEILFVLALYTGLRPNELKTAEIKGKFIVAVNSKRKTKTTVYKRIYIHKRLAAYLTETTVFPKLHEKYVSLEFPKYCPNHKLYDLRTTFYTRCDELGVSPPARDYFVGHSSGALTNAYRDLSDEYLIQEGEKLNKW
jgi:integrase